MNLVNQPPQIAEISPEQLEIANTYIQLMSLQETSVALDIPQSQVQEILQHPRVKSYIDQVYFETGFNNRYKMRQAMDAILQQKFQDLEEAQTGSSKDIADLLELSHRMRMQELDREIQLEKIKLGGTKPQTMVQINDMGNLGSNYNQLIQKLIEG